MRLCTATTLLNSSHFTPISEIIADVLLKLEVPYYNPSQNARATNEGE